MPTTTLEKVGSRLYFRNSPFAAKDRIKGIGGHFDFDTKCWWIGSAKKAAAEKLVAELNGGATEASVEVAESLGLRSDTPAEIVADKLRDAGRDKEAADLAKEDLSDCRVYAKVEYKGRTYYVIARTMSQGTTQQAPQPLRVRLATLQEDGPAFWTDAADCRLLKEYHGRQQWDGRRYSGRQVTVYTTIGSLRSFVAGQRQAEARGDEKCGGCGLFRPLVHDLETGAMCCRSCADMPAE